MVGRSLIPKRERDAKMSKDNAVPADIHSDDFETLSRNAVMEIAPNSDLDSMAVVFNLLRVANRMQQDFETNVHRPAGLSFAAFRVMFTIYAAGQINPLLLAKLSNVSPASISSILNTLERSGMVVRKKGTATDGRMVVVELTDEGARVLSQLWERNHRHEVAWAHALTARERATITRLLRKLVAYHPVPAADEPPRLVNHG
jgi:DNA-binding MarR family transcriptional regulator